MSIGIVLTLLVVFSAWTCLRDQERQPELYRDKTKEIVWSFIIGSPLVAYVFGSESGFFVFLAWLLVASRLRVDRPDQSEVPGIWSTPGTVGLIILNCAVFVVELMRSATSDPIALYSLGAIFTPYFSWIEGWRLITAQYLHAGAVHLLCNVVGLRALGAIVERDTGTLRFVVFYTLAGIGGMGAVVAAFHTGLDPDPSMVIGASAGVMGLVGFLFGKMGKIYRETSAQAGGPQIRSLSQILLLQFVVDMLVPEVSSTAHIGGAVTGALVGYFTTRIPRYY